ncbi:MAG: tetratricopeptide repeat protein [Saprospiraceae bacterium]|nr:tetratricopeptide repeat protein [Candidatus Vicinibacter affinis]MBK8404909.1 tetratricopeptide repeat protein [Candidatus Vicinibacter affinis]
MRFLIGLAILLSPCMMDAQDPRLALQYFNDGEFEKAAVLYQTLYQKFPESESYFSNLLSCMEAMGKTEESETLVKKELNRRPKDSYLYFVYGKMLSKRGEAGKSEKQYKNAIDNLPADVIGIHRIANAFIEQSEFDLAIATYEKGEKLMKGQFHFTYNLADLYRRKGETLTMLKYYVDGLEDGSINSMSLQNVLAAYLEPDKHKDLRALLYEKLESKPDFIPIIEILQWTFIQSKDFLNALRQAKALDKRTGENGSRVMYIANIAANEGDYKTAIDGYGYIKNLGQSGGYYLEAYRQLLINRRKQIVEQNNYTVTDLKALEADYQQFSLEYSGSRLAAPILIEFAELEARYLNNVDKAIEILLSIVKNPVIEPHTKAMAKLDLADYYLIQGERWESTLLYSQVDKDFQEDQLGELARFKNARLSYFAGDFNWAQEQFDILKQATTRLISNDAIDMSVFILDNLNQDTLGLALSDYAQTELKVFQNKYDEAMVMLDSILSEYKENSLLDDVLYLQANILNKQKKTEEAIQKYNKIIENHKEEIRADNALFELAKIYDYQLSQKEKAMSLYEKLFLDYSGSVLAIEARQRFRKLRGDAVQ